MYFSVLQSIQKAVEGGPEPDSPLMVSAQGGMRSCRSNLTLGKGLRQFAGGLAEGPCLESFHVAVSFVSINTPLLQTWMGLPHAPLYSKHTDLTIRVSDCCAVEEGSSASAAAALSLVAMLGGRLVSKGVVMTGTIDLSGNMLPVGDLEEKIRHCQECMVYIPLIVVPWGSYKNLKLEGDLKAYADKVVRPVRHFVEVLEVAVEGE